MFTKVLRSFGMRGRVLTLDAPISGDVIPLSEVNDQTFATGLLGQGVAIRPTGTRVIAPADAKVEAIFPTGHAVALNTVDGLDVLITLVWTLFSSRASTLPYMRKWVTSSIRAMYSLSSIARQLLPRATM